MVTEAERADAQTCIEKQPFGPFTGLHGRLLLMTAAFVVFAVMLIYPPLAANFRNSWLDERAQAAQIAVLAVEAAPQGEVSDELSRELLARAQVVSVAVQAEEIRELILAPAIRIEGPLVPVDLREEQGWPPVFSTFSHMFAPEGRFLRIIITPSLTDDSEMEIIVPEGPLKASLFAFSRNMLVIALIISGVVGALVYFVIYRLVVRPIRSFTEALILFSQEPESTEIEFAPGRTDELGRASAALSTMQKTVSQAFRQRKRLAELGEAVAKITHDLRNSLASAQLVSEGLSQSDDPRVRRAAPRLERSIQRAIGLAEATLRYGRAERPAPNVQLLNIIPSIEEAAAEAMAAWPDIELRMDKPKDGLIALADPDHIHRIVSNLVRNAARAIANQQGRREAGRITIRAFRQGESAIVEISDNGPGIPYNVMARLFQPFAASGSRDGSGLGLAIARELARGMKGELELSKSDSTGAAFTFRAPTQAPAQAS